MIYCLLINDFEKGCDLIDIRRFECVPMTDYSVESLASVKELEQICGRNEQIVMRAGIEHLKPDGGDRAWLCRDGDALVGFLAWYTSDGSVGNVNAMVHPDARRRGVFTALYGHAVTEMKAQGIRSVCFRVPSGSSSGESRANRMGGAFDRSEYAMTLALPWSKERSGSPAVRLRQAEPGDYEFMVKCSSRAFGESEAWTREYLTRTNEPDRISYIAAQDSEPIGMIRANLLGETASVIHDFCVLPARQGMGLGREILTAAVGLLQEQNRTNIRLSVVAGNAKALRLYQSAGFEVSSESRYYMCGL